MKIVFLKDYTINAEHKKGDTVDVFNQLAEELIKKKVARKAPKKIKES